MVGCGRACRAVPFVQRWLVRGGSWAAWSSPLLPYLGADMHTSAPPRPPIDLRTTSALLDTHPASVHCTLPIISFLGLPGPSASRGLQRARAAFSIPPM